MLRSVKDLEGYVVRASDGPIGHVKDFFFDDQAWVVRYLVVETGSWLKSREVLISPLALRPPDRKARLLPVAVTKEQVRNSPDVDTQLPVSRQHEVQYAGYYGYPNYWEGAKHGNVGSYQEPTAPSYDAIGSIQAKRAEHAATIARASGGSTSDDPQLRSCRAVMRYLVHAKDGDVGEVNGMLLDDATWTIRYLVVSTGYWSRWSSGADYAPAVLDRPCELGRGCHQRGTNASGDQGDAPAYDPTAFCSSGPRKKACSSHHARPGYWPSEPLS